MTPETVPPTDSTPATAADRYKAAMLEVARITSEAARKEREMWLRVVKKLRDVGVR